MTDTAYLLGIDLGTSSVKAVLATAAGKIVAAATAEYPLLHPQPGFTEQEPEQWWTAIGAAVRQVVDAASHPAIAAIGLSGQMHGTVLLDSQQRTVAPAVIWPDQRSQRQVAAITAAFGAETLYRTAGSPVSTGFQAATIRWFQDEAPARWEQVRMVLVPKDYVRWRLTGEFATDPSDGAGTLLFDEARRNWSQPMLDLLHLDRDLLPPVQPSSKVAGQLTREAAAALGLAAGVPVITGAADTACSALGAGAVDTDRLLVTISTGGQLVQPVDTVTVDLRGRIHTFCSALEPGPGQAGWYQMGAILSAGLALRWLRDQVLGWQDAGAYDRMNAAADAVAPGAEGLLFLPYLVGERTPHMDPTARSVFYGLTLRHGQGALVRAVMEGVTFACYDAYSVLRELGATAERIVLAGGGARSPVWRQIMADTFGVAVEPLETTEQSALGAVLLAGAGIGLFDLASTACAWARYGPATVPDPGRHALYQERFAAFRGVYQRNRGWFESK